MTISTQLISLGVTKVGEKSLVIHALSRDLGRRSFIVSVGKGASMSLYLPLNILDAEVQENPKSDLWRLRAISATDPLSGIRGNIYKNTMTLFMSEVLYRTLRDGVYEEGLFDWCRRSILTLDAMESDFSNFHLRFLLELAASLGFSPTVDDLAPFCSTQMQNVSCLLNSPFGESMLLPLSGRDRSEIAEIILEYLSHHTESAIRVQSLKVLSELYSK